jgi:hypothetical protein
VAIKLPTRPSARLMASDGMSSIFNTIKWMLKTRDQAGLLSVWKYLSTNFNFNSSSQLVEYIPPTASNAIILHLFAPLYFDNQHIKCPKPTWYPSSWFSKSSVPYKFFANDLTSSFCSTWIFSKNNLRNRTYREVYNFLTDAAGAAYYLFVA